MIPLIKHYVIAFFFDENVARRLIAGLAGMLSMAGTTALAFGPAAIMAWSRRELLQHAAIALSGAVFAMLPGPRIAPPPPVLVKG